jgi:hypothetical protein
MNTTNNNNLIRMNELLSKIGTKNKSLFNKLTLKTSKSKEFLDILQRKINMIEDNVKLTNIEKKTDELEKIFLKFEKFSDKIKNKNDRNLKDRYDNIYKNDLYYICPYLSSNILLISTGKNGDINIDDLRKLKKTQKELLKLFIKYYDFDNNNREYIEMLEILDIISEKIEIHPEYNKTNQKLVEEFSQLQIKSKNNNRKQLLPNLSSQVEIFSNKNAAEYYVLLSKIKNNEGFNYNEFQNIASEVFTIYKSALDIAFSILEQINLHGLTYNKMNNKSRIDIELLNKSIENLYNLCMNIIEIKKRKFNRNNNHDLLLMNKTLKSHKDFINLKNKILDGKNK